MNAKVRQTAFGALATFAIVLLAATPATAADANSVQAFRSQIISDAATLDLDASQGPGAGQVNDAVKGQADLKSLIKPALAAAQGNADLTAAIKKLYIAANAYFQSYLDITGLPDFDPYTNTLVLNPKQVQQQHAQAQLKADLDSQDAALQLEMQLAGIDG
jgi:hypothetical protein